MKRIPDITNTGRGGIRRLLVRRRIRRTFIWFTLLTYPVVGHAQQGSRPEFPGGAWVATLSSLEDPRWRLEDLLCTSCTLPALEYTKALLNDPRNDELFLQELKDKVFAFNRGQLASLLTTTALETAAGYDQADDPVNECIPTGLFYAAGPLPIWIEQHDDRVVFRYEFWHTVRTVYADGREHPADLPLTRMGHSISWYDGSTLVVETVGIEPHIFGAVSGVDGLRTSPRARGIERYTLSEDGERLDIETTIVDPVMMRRPLTLVSARLWAPEVEYQDEPQCEALSGIR